MAASFPNAKKTFSQVVNGVTKLVAALFNTPYDEIEAIETYIGATGGGAQSYSESLKGLLGNYRRGCAVEYKGDADLYVRAGEIAILDASGNMRLRKNTSDTTVDWGNLDTGSEAAGTLYYVYAVADAQATTFTVVISTNATTPTGCTFYKLLGSFYNDASGNIKQESFYNYTSNTLKFGTRIDKSSDFGAQIAYTDGFLEVMASNCGSQGVLVYNDSNADPTTLRGQIKNTSAATNGNVTILVRKGEYWKVVDEGAPTINGVWWTPLC